MSTATTTTITGALLLSPANAEKLGLYVPTALAESEDMLLGYGPDDDLVAWGPASERSKVEGILRMYS